MGAVQLQLAGLFALRDPWESPKVSLANLWTFPWIAEREEAGELKLHGAHFSISEGRLYILDEAEDTFRPV